MGSKTFTQKRDKRNDKKRNEEEWIELSLLSIKDFADEIVVVNNIPYFKIGKVTVRKLELALNVQVTSYNSREVNKNP